MQQPSIVPGDNLSLSFAKACHLPASREHDICCFFEAHPSFLSKTTEALFGEVPLDLSNLKLVHIARGTFKDVWEISIGPERAFALKITDEIGQMEWVNAFDEDDPIVFHCHLQIANREKMVRVGKEAADYSFGDKSWNVSSEERVEAIDPSRVGELEAHAAIRGAVSAYLLTAGIGADCKTDGYFCLPVDMAWKNVGWARRARHKEIAICDADVASDYNVLQVITEFQSLIYPLKRYPECPRALLAGFVDVLGAEKTKAILSAAASKLQDILEGKGGQTQVSLDSEKLFYCEQMNRWSMQRSVSRPLFDLIMGSLTVRDLAAMQASCPAAMVSAC